jgi:hypothetical protein
MLFGDPLAGLRGDELWRRNVHEHPRECPSNRESRVHEGSLHGRLRRALELL